MPAMEDVALAEVFLAMRSLVGSPYIQVFVILLFLDLFTGYLKAFKTKIFSSKIGTQGLLKHAFVFVAVILVCTYARALGVRQVGIAWVSFFIINYTGSILENWEAIDWFFPSFLKPYMNQLKKQAEDEITVAIPVDKLPISTDKEEEHG